MRKLLNNFNNKSIFFRLSAVILIVFLAMSIITIYNFILFTSEKKISVYKTVNQANHQALNKIDDYIKDLSNITKFPLTYKQNDKTYIKYLNDFNKTNTMTLDFQKLNEQMFEQILAYKNNVESCFIFNLSGFGDYKNRTPIYQVANPLYQPWFQKSIERFGKPVIVDTYELPYVSNNKGPVYVFGIARGIVRFESSKVIGILLVNTKIDYFDNLCKEMNITKGQRTIILHDNYVIYDSVRSNITSTARKELSGIKWISDRKQTLVIDGVKYLATSTLSDYSDWRMISLIPYNEIFQDLIHMQIITIAISLVVITISLLLVFHVSSHIVRPMNKLVTLMKLAENGEFDEKISITSNDEIGVLAKSFNSMTSKINTLIQEVYVEQIKKNELELQMLQTQINPHFIYNTLESISMMATINDDDITSEMASNLGSILRYGINKNKSETTVNEELEQLNKYISLQNVRFGSVYTFSIKVDPKLYVITIIKLILQPIVENAIYHGMSDVRSGGLIVVSGFCQDKNTLIFEISDNGKGMSQEQTKILNDYINDKNNLFKSIGLRNVNKRIKLRYGEEYGLFIESSPESGTTVIVKLPIENK